MHVLTHLIEQHDILQGSLTSLQFSKNRLTVTEDVSVGSEMFYENNFDKIQDFIVVKANFISSFTSHF